MDNNDDDPVLTDMDDDTTIPTADVLYDTPLTTRTMRTIPTQPSVVMATTRITQHKSATFTSYNTRDTCWGRGSKCVKWSGVVVTAGVAAPLQSCPMEASPK